MTRSERGDRLVIVIGGMKCGTSSLHLYMNAHPSIQMSARKELDFFIEERNWSRGPEWYYAQLPTGEGWVGEASPNYTKYPEFKGVAQRMAETVPNAKLIYIVRHPIERAVSSYIHGVARGWECRSINDALRDPESSVHVMPSCYGLQLQQYLDFFDRDSIFISSMEHMRSSRKLFMEEIFGFLNVESQFQSPVFEQIKNPALGRTRPTAFTRRLIGLPGGKYARAALGKFIEPQIGTQNISVETRESLREFLRADIEQFRLLSGKQFSEWGPEI